MYIVFKSVEGSPQGVISRARARASASRSDFVSTSRLVSSNSFIAYRTRVSAGQQTQCSESCRHPSSQREQEGSVLNRTLLQYATSLSVLIKQTSELVI